MNSFSEILCRHLPRAGTLSGPLANTEIYRVDEVYELTPIVYDPSVYFVAQGEKEAWLQEQRYVYNPGQFLLLTVPLPLHCRVFNATPRKPFLAIKLNIDLSVLKELLGQMQTVEADTDQSDSGIFVSNMTDNLKDAVHRFISTLDHPEQQSVLAPMIYREILFHILQGPEAQRLRGFATADRHSNRIALVIDFIHQNFSRTMRIEELAAIAAMSESTFYEHFKNVTQLSPLQYLKNIRLHHARHQISVEQLPVSEAAYLVGYESPSQFSREYKRLFGFSPAQHSA
ncbi:helix-turn-helix protein [Alteromonadaceae bacterium 2753L.S.0a.02]|nr:helix-turn-helix protein [Alteromonadaceae bacterium 2753L.S.0a.02]